MKSLIPPSAKLFLKSLSGTRYYKTLKPHWHRQAVGGLWEEVGKLQFNFMVSEGLKPRHYFLDVGCGSLRGGVHFVRYLETGHYFGIDINQDLLEAGKGELKKNHLLHKKPILVQMSKFHFASLGQTFDYALAQSVFTHLPLNSILMCIMNIDKCLFRGVDSMRLFLKTPKGSLTWTR